MMLCGGSSWPEVAANLNFLQSKQKRGRKRCARVSCLRALFEARKRQAASIHFQFPFRFRFNHCSNLLRPIILLISALVDWHSGQRGGSSWPRIGHHFCLQPPRTNKVDKANRALSNFSFNFRRTAIRSERSFIILQSGARFTCKCERLNKANAHQMQQ